MIYLLFAVYIILTVSGLMLFKLGSTDLSMKIVHHIINFSINSKFILGLLCYLSSFLLWLYIIAKMKLSLALPISVGLVNLLVLICSALIIGEKITSLQWIGVIIIIVGLFIINIGGR